jgi:hypothetical protein
MKKAYLIFILLIFVVQACTITVQPIAATPIVVTVVHTQIPPSITPPTIPTPVPATVVATQARPTAQPTVSTGVEVSVGPLSIVLSPELARGARGSQIPRATGQNVAPWDVTPGHNILKLEGYPLSGKTHQPQIYIYPAQAYAEMLPGAFESIRRLDNILYGPNGPSLSADKLPIVPFFNAQQAFTSKSHLISFKNGGGVRFLTEYAQYPVPANNQDLFYNFHGVTRDGAYYIIAIFPITVPVLAGTSDTGAIVPPGGVPYPNPANMPAYYSAVSDLLNAQSADVFTPNLSQLDALIQSIRVTP